MGGRYCSEQMNMPGLLSSKFLLVCILLHSSEGVAALGPSQTVSSESCLIQHTHDVTKTKHSNGDVAGKTKSFTLLDGPDSACRSEGHSDANGVHVSLFAGVKTLEGCKAKCVRSDLHTAGFIPPSCPATEEGQTFGNVATSQVNECSGLAASRINVGLYWANNDSGARQKIYGFTKYGVHKATLWIVGAYAQDWEDVAVGPGPDAGQSYLYIADTGDNYKRRSSVQIYRTPEPAVPTGRDRNWPIRVRAQKFDIRYPDGSHDCEAMFVDQGQAAHAQGTAGRVYVITKGWGTSDVYWVDLPTHSISLTFTKSSFGSLPFPGQLVTGADISPLGSFIVVRTYGQLWMWPRPHWRSVEESLASDRCEVHQKGEHQGEAVAFGSEGDHYITVSEGKYPTVWHFGMGPTVQQGIMSLVDHPITECNGVEYSSGEERCAVWNRGVKVQSSAKTVGSQCLTYE